MGEYTSGGNGARIHNAKEVTAEDILREADEIWRKCKQRKLKPGDLDAADKLLEEMRKAHPDFSISYPIVLRYIVQFQSYNTKALKKYLMRIKEHPWTSEKEYLDSQTDYVVILYKELHPKWNKTEVTNLWNNIRAQLQHEDDVFKRYLKEFEKEVESEEQRLKKESRDELVRYFRGLRTDTVDTQVTQGQTDAPDQNTQNV